MGLDKAKALIGANPEDLHEVEKTLEPSRPFGTAAL